MIKEHVKDYVTENPSTKNIQIKINDDGAQMTRNSNFIWLSFSILQTGRDVMMAKGNRTIAILNREDKYANLKESFGNTFSELNSMIAEGKICIDDTPYSCSYIR